MIRMLVAGSRRSVGFLVRLDPIRIVALGYLSYVGLGWLLLSLPISRQAAGVPLLDHLFTAASAMSTTGLATVSIADTYSCCGELIVLLLIQAGGLGYMTIGSFVTLAISGRLPALNSRVSRTTLTLPAGLDLGHFLRLVVCYTLLVEAAGAVALYTFVFQPQAVPQPLWQAVFHSVSAFCTAGFALFNDSFESLRGDVSLNLIVIVLSYLGAVGFIVVSDAWHSVTRADRRVTLTSKIILLSTVMISLVGTVLFFLHEPAVRTLPAGERWLASWFQVMTASTTVGFNTVPIASLSASSTFLLVVIMLIGASPSGTGGGIKTTTFTALWAVMLAVIRRRPEPVFLGREIPEVRVRAAIAGFMFYVVVLAAGTYALSLFEPSSLADQVFECVSALGTVGLSRGITSTLTDAGKLIIVLLMYLGRIGPVVLGMAFFRVPAGATAETPEEDIAI